VKERGDLGRGDGLLKAMMVRAKRVGVIIQGEWGGGGRLFKGGDYFK